MDMPRNAEVSKSRIGDGVQLEGVFLEEVWVWQASCGPVKLITISNKCNNWMEYFLSVYGSYVHYSLSCYLWVPYNAESTLSSDHVLEAGEAP